MITFELYRQLDIRLFQTVAAYDSNYGSCAKYIFDGDSIILLGTNKSIRFDMNTKAVSDDVPMKNWDIETEAVLWFSEESNEAALVRLICNCLGYYMGMDSFSSQEEFDGMISGVNAALSKYNLKVIVDNQGMCMFSEDAPCSFEDAINIIMDMDENSLDESMMVDLINEALYYRKLDRMDEAAERLEKVVRFAEHTKPIYTDTLFLLAETYYFDGNYERAIQLYYRCHLEFIEDENDFYIHIGHALLDERMKKYERQIRIYYRSLLDPEYADIHRDAVATAQEEIGEVFDEYEETCRAMGEKKYTEYKNSLPEDADDIDELMIAEKLETESEPDNVKEYKNIILKEPTVSSLGKCKSIQEMFADGLAYFMDGDYEKAFDVYSQIKEDVPADSDYATWAYFMLGKMYCIFDDIKKAAASFDRCDVNRFGKVYRQDDFLLLFSHVHILLEDFESDPRFRYLIRGRVDNYYSQYDREYIQLLQDRKLMKSYRFYEEECIKAAEESFENVLIKKNEQDNSKKGFLKSFAGLFGGN